jgi:hypothetical protein
MATKPNTTAPAVNELPAWKVAAVILTPVWIILATLANAVIGGEVTL